MAAAIEGAGVRGKVVLRRDRRELGRGGVVGVGADEGTALEAPYHHMVEGPGSIKARLAGHDPGKVARHIFGSNVAPWGFSESGIIGLRERNRPRAGWQ